MSSGPSLVTSGEAQTLRRIVSLLEPFLLCFKTHHLTPVVNGGAHSFWHTDTGGRRISISALEPLPSGRLIWRLFKNRLLRVSTLFSRNFKDGSEVLLFKLSAPS